MQKLQPPSIPMKKITTYPVIPSRIEVLSSPLPLFENLVGGSTPSVERGFAHYYKSRT